MDLGEIILRPIITEKATAQAAQGKYYFQVKALATKGQIKKAVARTLKVRVVSVNIINMPGKSRQQLRSRKKGNKVTWKKAIVQLGKGEKVDFLEAPAEKPKEEKK